MNADRSHSWAAGWAAHRLRRAFIEGLDALPTGAGRRWAVTMIVGFAALLGFTYALERWVASIQAAGRLAWEADFLRRLEAESPLSFSDAVWVQTFGTDITLALIIAFVASTAVQLRYPLRALAMIFGYVGMDLMVRFGWAMWNRLRPDIIAQGIASPEFASFPSGHTGKTLVVYGLAAYFVGRASESWIERVALGLLLVVLVAVVGFGRLRMGVHWPSDVLGGALLGAVWLLVLIYALRRAGD